MATTGLASVWSSGASACTVTQGGSVHDRPLHHITTVITPRVTTGRGAECHKFKRRPVRQRRKERRKCTTNGADSYWLQLAGGSVSVGECGKTSGSLSCPLVAPLSRLVGMNGYNSVILCKPTLHSGKGLQGRLSYRLARTQTSPCAEAVQEARRPLPQW